jgi:hypothetical protein
MSESTTTNDICRQMNDVRCSLGDEVEGIVDSTRTLTDWRYYVRQYPWVCLAGATALGFMIVPTRVEVIRPSADMLEELARRNKLVVKASPDLRPKSGLTGAVFSVLANAAVRGALHFLERNAGRVLERSTAANGGNGRQ